MGERIRLDFEGEDGSSSSEGEVIFIDSEHVIVQFHFAGLVGASGFNRSGFSYEDVLEITGADFPHSEFDRYIDILDESTLEHTLGAEEE